MNEGDTGGEVAVSLFISKRNSQRFVGVAVLKRGAFPSVDLYEFVENDQFSNIDALFVQLGNVVLYLSDEYEENKGDARKLSNLMHGRSVEVVFVKRSVFKKYEEAKGSIAKVNFEDPRILTACEVDRPISLSCLACLVACQHLHDSSSDQFSLRCATLSTYMRLDSAAADAVNLLPKPDHPSQYGSLYGVLNRCRTKMGSRMLERWLRQPLVDHIEIKSRQDIVEIMVKASVLRNQLVDGPLKSVPDLDGIVLKMAGKKAGLKEIINLWSFTKALPRILRICEELANTCESSCDATSFKYKILTPLSEVAEKFEVYQQLVEHVVDLNKLPELVVNCEHDPELQELQDELNQLHSAAEDIYDEARGSWASFADLKLERNSQYGYILRSTKAEDERQFQQQKNKVIIKSIKKNGVYCSTSALDIISGRVLDLERLYQSKQTVVVVKALESAITYLPVAESTAAVIAELDVLTSFASVAAVSPDVYSRPVVRERGSGGIYFKAARHPCVELMDNVQFIANDYDLQPGHSNFQIITGPNMGGKSTFIRGIGSIVVMAQVGSFVPCASADLAVVDCILARVGAGDAVQKGVSTFMAEMLEASVILETATADSLIIIDELGRGTSTFDGFGIARAISEFIVTEKKCACLFATHFHDLTSLEQQHPSVVNQHVAVHIDAKNQMTMLYNVQKGACAQSYGIYVAMAADFPASVIQSAKRKAEELENIEGYWNCEHGREMYRKISSAVKSFVALPVEEMPASALKDALRLITAI